MARILVVEDNELERVLLAELLKSAGHDVVFAQDGEGALEEWRRSGADLVVTDVMIPGLDGLELLESIRAEDPHVPVIAISGVTAAKLNKAMRSGAAAILTKPVNAGELYQEVSRALDPHEDQEVLDL